MDRRDFLQNSGIIMAGLMLDGRAFAAGRGSGALEKRIVPLNQKWHFFPSIPPNGHDINFDEAAMAPVTIPHTNKILPWHSFDEKEYAFVSLYRRKFRLPQSAKGKRIFVDCEGAMTATTVWINGHRLGEYKGGYTPFSFELSDYVHFDDENILALDVDSTERADIPPFGNRIDYLTFGGLYREVALRIVPPSFIANIYAAPQSVTTHPELDVRCFVEQAASRGKLSLHVQINDGQKIIAKSDKVVEPGAFTSVFFPSLPKVQLWQLDNPKLYSVSVRLFEDGNLIDEDTRRFGFREARFTDMGFSLNGKIVKLRGLNRHQTFPFMGQAAPKRAQRRDAWILRKELHCNIVRTSHYPQSRHFLDACDELGLLVLEEITGWQHIGDTHWQDIAVDNVGRMITRDWNHPAVILWGVRINESKDNHDFYLRTSQAARQTDPFRQIGGIRANINSELLEDVFTMNDFHWPPQAPNHPLYLNTEFCGHMFPTKSTDNNLRHTEHMVRHARMYDWMESNPQYSGAIGWCAFDYNTHAQFGAGDRICYHGVMDIFRIPKPAAGFYKSQISPEKEVVLEPAFHWAPADQNERMQTIMLSSNCDRLKLYIREKDVWRAFADVEPDRKQFPHLKYPPFTVDIEKLLGYGWGDLKVEGYVDNALKITKQFSGRGVSHSFEVSADDDELFADGSDMTRVTLRVTDEFDNALPFVNDAITLSLEGPATLIGDNPFVLVGGVGAVWVKTSTESGTVRLTASHPRLGNKTIRLSIRPTEAETI